MPSLLSGCEYDIFVSYRHNDNLDGWVSDFVQNLERELKATLKEPVSIYFDKNPHDGLLETHTVDKSLEGKLRCAVFIPILSQTYCDPRSFAWEFEFRAFNKLAKADPFGMDVRLGNGNMTSRILPVKIHTLDTTDLSTIETELGGPLRSIEFIYREPGVNRPLKLTDSRADNQNKTDYHNQVNKTAQAIKEIIHSLQDPISAQAPAIKESSIRRRPKITATYVRSGVFVLLAVILAILWPAGTAEVDKSIAVIPFVDMSPGNDNEWFSDGLTDEVMSSLANFVDLKVTAHTSSFYFKGKNIPIPEIAQALGVANVLEGTVKIVGDQLRITARLIRASDGLQLWVETYNREKKDLMAVQIDIAENIGKALLAELTPDAKERIADALSGSPAAREFYMKGLYLHDRYRTSLKDEDFENAEKEFLQAIQTDRKYVAAYAELANLYDTYGGQNGNQLRDSGTNVLKRKPWALRDSIIGIVDKLSPRSPQVLKVKWNIFDRAGQIDSTMTYLVGAYDGMPNDPAIHSFLGSVYGSMGLQAQSDKFFARARALDPLSITPYPRMADLALKSTHYDTIAWRDAVEAGLKIDPKNADLLLRQLRGTQKRTVASYLEEQEFREKNDLVSPKLLQANIYAIQGRRAEALRLGHSLPIYYWLHDRDGYIRLLDSLQGINRRDITMWISPWAYDFVKDDPRFKVIQKHGLEKLENFKRKYGALKWKGLD